MGTAKASCARLGLAVICNFWYPGTLALRAEPIMTRAVVGSLHAQTVFRKQYPQ